MSFQGKKTSLLSVLSFGLAATTSWAPSREALAGPTSTAADQREETASIEASLKKAVPATERSEKEVPFWRKSQARLQQIRDARSIQVSSRREDLPSGKMSFTFNGAGDVSRSCLHTFEVASQLERLSDVSEAFKGVIHDTDRNQIFLSAEALGFRGQILMNVDPILDAVHESSHEPSLERTRQMNFEVIWGSFQGLRGELLFEELDFNKCEVSVVVHYQTAKPPLPKALFGFALEVLIQKVAERMRSLVEWTSENEIRAYGEKMKAKANAKDKENAGDPSRFMRAILREKVPLDLVRPQLVSTKAISSPTPAAEKLRPSPPKNPQTP